MKLASTVMVFCVAALIAIGLVMLYSASIMETGAKHLVQQVVWCLVGLIAAGVAAAVDYRQLKKVSWAVFVVSLILLALVFAPGIGKKVNGARRWIGLASFRFQPSELAKIALILILAHYGDHYQRQMPTFWRGLILPGLLIGVVLVMVFVEPDRGATILLALVGATLMIVAGTRARYVLAPALLGILFLGYSFWHDPMRSQRIYSWLHLYETRQKVGLQAYQAKLALGSGGWTGVGLGNGRQKTGFVPFVHTDFILPNIGEELGLVATLTVLGLFVALTAAMLTIASRAGDTFGILLGGGFACLIGIQAFINIAVVTGVFPNKGMPLPFISYGGSNLFAMLVMIGVLFSIARHSEEETWREANPIGEPAPDPA